MAPRYMEAFLKRGDMVLSSSLSIRPPGGRRRSSMLSAAAAMALCQRLGWFSMTQEIFMLLPPAEATSIARLVQAAASYLGLRTQRGAGAKPCCTRSAAATGRVL